MSRLERHRDDRPHGGPPASLMDFLAVRLTYELAACRDALAERRRRWSSRSAPLSRRDAQRQGAPAIVARDACLPAVSADAAQRDLLRGAARAAASQRPRDPGHPRGARRLHAARAVPGSVRAPPSSRGARRARRPAPPCTLRPQDGTPALSGRVLLRRARGVPASSARGGRARRGDLRCTGLLRCGHSLSCARRSRTTFRWPRWSIMPTHHIDERPDRTPGAQAPSAHRSTQDLGSLLRIRCTPARARSGAAPCSTSRSAYSPCSRCSRASCRRALPASSSAGRRICSCRLRAPSSPFTTTWPPTPGIVRGFKVDERVARVATVLENIGLVDNFSRLIFVLGHGSTTLNNPHKSAYDCGACGGRQGGPNARVVAHMANDPEVRAGLRERGIVIPEDTLFVGGQHDTCNDAITLFETDAHPGQSPRAVHASARPARRSARQERPGALPTPVLGPAQRLARCKSLRHVEARSEHLAEPRPEFGHATNAVAIIGRRAVSRGLFLDRRAFLLSYDPTIDPNGTILERTLAAATPVGAGINLEYYFSHVDNERYGAGSKLPHNVTGLVGVMTGHASDLRTGLPRQMIEIHEPVRLLVIVEATPERLLEIAGRQAEVRELVVNRWVQLVSLDPDSGAMHVFTDQGFVPYTPNPVELPGAPQLARLLPRTRRLLAARTHRSTGRRRPPEEGPCRTSKSPSFSRPAFRCWPSSASGALAAVASGPVRASHGAPGLARVPGLAGGHAGGRRLVLRPRRAHDRGGARSLVHHRRLRLRSQPDGGSLERHHDDADGGVVRLDRALLVHLSGARARARPLLPAAQPVRLRHVPAGDGGQSRSA